MNKSPRVKAHILRDRKLSGWRDRIAGKWGYRDLVADRDWFEGWISFDAVTFNPSDGLLYCGLNSLDGDLLYSFEPSSGKFECLGTRSWADRFDAKIHRTILHNPSDGCLYFATSLLHDMDQQREAGGGKLVRYDPARRAYDILGIPAPRLYLQSIAADWARGILYSFTYPSEAVYRTGLASRRSDLVAYLGNAILMSQPHNAVVDRRGWLWATAAETRAWDETAGPEPIRLVKYHPEGDVLAFLDHGLPRWEGAASLLEVPGAGKAVTPVLAETRHKQDYGFCDSMAYDGDRYIYAGTVAGVLARIDTLTGETVKIANVISSGRFPALAFRDGVLYGAGGMHGRTQLMRWDVRTEKIELFGDLVDPDLQERPARIHELAVDAGGRVYLAENDNHERSSFLWSVDLP